MTFQNIFFSKVSDIFKQIHLIQMSAFEHIFGVLEINIMPLYTNAKKNKTIFALQVFKELVNVRVCVCLCVK